MSPRTFLAALAFLAFISLGLPDGLLGVAWPSISTGFGGAARRARYTFGLYDGGLFDLELSQRAHPPGAPHRQRAGALDSGGSDCAAGIRTDPGMARDGGARISGRARRGRNRRGAQRLRRGTFQRPHPQLVARFFRPRDHAGAADRDGDPRRGVRLALELRSSRGARRQCWRSLFF